VDWDAPVVLTGTNNGTITASPGIATTSQFTSFTFDLPNGVPLMGSRAVGDEYGHFTSSGYAQTVLCQFVIYHTTGSFPSGASAIIDMTLGTGGSKTFSHTYPLIDGTHYITLDILPSPDNVPWTGEIRFRLDTGFCNPSAPDCDGLCELNFTTP
jgi:hypothetical protein